MTALAETLPWCGRTPRRWQTEALDAVLVALRAGVKRPLVQACTGSGKSVWLSELAAICKGRVLVTTPSQQLVAQLSATIEERCPGEVGRAYQHAWEVDRRVVVTCNASLERLLEEQPEWACWIADEAHRMEGERLRQVQDRIVRKVSCGLTATPFRADKRGMQNWDQIVYQYPSGRAVEEGVLVPWRAVRWDGVGKPTTDELVEAWVREAIGPGIVSATKVDDAEQFAARLGPDMALAIHDRMNRKERQRRIDLLRDGQIKALVHVSLLAEGVDLPWLCWLAMRRPVGSAVRLVQEVGRVLRASPGKTEAVLYDPYDLLGELGLTHEASLEDALTSSAEQAASEEWSIEELAGLDAVCKLPPPKAVEILTGWVSDVVESLRSYHMIPASEYGNGPWRRRSASEKQRQALVKMATWARYFPDPRHRKAVRWLLGRPELRKGPASDLMDVLGAFAKAITEKGWGWKCPVAIPTIEVPEWV